MDSFPTDTLDRYKKEIEIDCTIDELNLKEVQMRLPGIKHKWVARLIQAKGDLKKLHSIRYKAQQQLKDNIQAPIAMPEKNLINATTKQDVIIKIDKQIVQQELIIEYLTKVETIMKSMTYDLGNLIKILILETT